MISKCENEWSEEKKNTEVCNERSRIFFKYQFQKLLCLLYKYPHMIYQFGFYVVDVFRYKFKQNTFHHIILDIHSVLVATFFSLFFLQQYWNDSILSFKTMLTPRPSNMYYCSVTHALLFYISIFLNTFLQPEK